MNHHLETVLNFIQQSKDLTPAEKNMISNAVQKTDDELEHKNRDLEIEASLEKVRAQALSMRKPDELTGICEILFAELRILGFSEMRNTMINIHDDDKASFINYDYSDEIGKSITQLFYNTHPVIEKQIKEIRSAKDAFSVTTFSGKELDEWKAFRKSRGEKDDPRLANIDTLYYYFYSIGTGSIGISSFSALPEEKLKVLKRFRNVFDFAYRRYMDVAQAEVQAKDAKIETALERVRAQAMSMRKPEELATVGEIIFTELKSLGFADIRNSEIIINNDTRETILSYYYSDYGVTGVIEVFYKDHPTVKGWAEEMQRAGDSFVTITITESEIAAWRKYREEIGYLSDPKLDQVTVVYYYSYSIGPGALSISTFKPVSDEQLNILERLRNVFGLAYRRYADVAQAEAQAREAKIEASLERVRGKAMAMHSSEDLSMTVNVFFKELKALGITPIRCGVGQVDGATHTTNLTVTTSSQQGDSFQVIGKLRQEGHPVLEGIYDHWKLQKEYHPVLQGDDIKAYYQVTKNQIAFPEYDEHITQYGNMFYFKEGFVFAWTENELSEEELKVFRRFTSVLSLTYRRYADLRDAEAQARESLIEVALERVRSKAMAMQKSEDLSLAVATIFDELDKLKLGMLRCGIAILSKEKRCAEIWTTTISAQGKIVQVSGDESIDIHPLLHGAFDAWLNQGTFSYVLEGEDLLEFYRALTKVNFKLPESQSITTAADGLKQYYYVTAFQAGNLYAFCEAPFTEEAKTVMKRFADVFNLAYTRFNDLKQAEQQTQQARIEAAMERVRGRALAMQEPEELLEVAHVLRHEMGLLGVEEIETGTIFIFDESSDTAQFGFSAKDSNHPEKPVVTDTVTLDLNQTWAGKEFLQFFKSKEDQFSLRMEASHRSEWIKYIYSLSSKVNNYFGDTIPDKSYHLFKFSNGAVGAASADDISEDSWDLLKRAASVFSLAYSRFKDLTKARIDLQNLKEEKKRSDSLLLNILPEEIANELKQFGKSYARKHEEVTILFADIKGFSSIAENLSAEDLVAQLDECFRAFDKIVEKHGLEKIKTIGDAYVCACGLPKPVNDNAVKTVKAALDMLDFLKGFSISKKIQDLPAFEFRFGIHTGPVVTGVVGLKKFTYDIWGDAVNLAARMEQHGEAGRINVSGNTYQLIKDKFHCTHRGKILAKNKGEIDMYFVEQL